MRLRRIEIRNFRKLDAVTIDGLGDGLTLLSGDNEEGKSTVLAALKAALFEHHTVGGAVREAMSPLGRSDTPEVAVEFELGGVRYALRKAFRRGGAWLTTPTGELRDDAAEQKLLELLRFERRSGRSEAKPQHLGLQALFWVDQGTTFAGFEALTGGRERLSRAIEAEVGGVAIGERGQKLMALVDEEVARFWTRTGRETGELAEATRRAAELREERTKLEVAQQRYEAAVDELARLRDERRRAVEQDQIGRARETLDRLRRELDTIGVLEARRDQARAVLAERAAAWQQLADQAGQRAQHLAQAEALGRQIATAQAEMATARAARDAAEQALAAADAAERAAVDRQAGAEQRRLEVERRRRLNELEAEIGRIARAQAEASAAAQLVRGLRARIDANPATAQRLEGARKAEGERVEAQAGLRAVATRVELYPVPGAVARRDGTPLDPAQPLHVTERTELELAAFGRVVLSPGAGELDARRAALANAQEALSRALAALGAADLPAAEALLGERTRLVGELTAAEARVKAVLDAQDVDDVARLDDRLAELHGRRDRLLAEGAIEAVGDPAALRSELAVLDEDRERLRAAREAARAETERCAKGASGQRVTVAGQESAVDQLLQQQRAAAGQLAAERDRQADDALARHLADAESAKAEAQTTLASVEREIVAVDADLVRDRVQQADRRLGQLQEELRRLDAAVNERQIELRTLGADAVGERLAECRQRLGLAEEEHARLLRQARAWRLLHDELAAAAASARDALLAPVRDRLRPYLRRLFPDAEPVLDPETLELTHLRRAGQDERFTQLSVGTREQIAVLVRLAMARLLLEREGEAPCIVLDDALVYADEGRFEIMKTILEQAARELQILILTCRPRDYLGLDARHLRLDATSLAATA